MNETIRPERAGGPVLLLVGTRKVLVDPSPVPASAARHRTHVLVAQGGRCLEFRPGWRSRLFALVWLLAGAVLGGAFTVAAELEQGSPGVAAGSIPLVLGLVCVAVGSALLAGARRFRLDGASGQLTVRLAWSRRTIFLTHILAVQLTDGGSHEGTEVGDGFWTYQLNLVLRGRHEPERLNLTNDADEAFAQQAAVRLAEFLRVPLVDQRG